MREKQTNKKMSSLFSDVLAVINHRWLSEGNKTCAVMHLLFHGGLFSLNVVIYLFISVHVCVRESWVPRYRFQSLLPEKCNREYGTVRIRGKKEKETVQCPF